MKSASPSKTKLGEVRLQGAPISRGIAIGRPFVFAVVEDDVPEFSIPKKEIEKEIKRYLKALNEAKKEVRKLQKRMEKEQVVEGSSILEAHLQMMQDSLMTTKVEQVIQEQQKNAEWALQTVIKEYQKKFLALSDPLFRERFKDVEDIYRRVLKFLLHSVRISLAEIPADSVVFASELSAADIAEANRPLANAIVAETVGPTSHTAIIAKARGIPLITSVGYHSINMVDVDCVIVDGQLGQVIFNPTPATRKMYEDLSAQLALDDEKLRKCAGLKAETFDGYEIRLSANIDFCDEAAQVAQFGGEGIGLFRSEYLYLDRSRFPTEEEQYEIYRKVTESMEGRPVVIRTFDIGGDKVMRNQPGAREVNPYLGCRAIRFLLRERDIFKQQLRAILRASAHGDIRILFPMLCALTELQEAKLLVEEVKEELRKEKIKFAKHVPIGSMIEVPSAAIISDLLAKECDFLSIGTNDLVQYSLAVDRGNQTLSELYTPTHPSVIRLIRMVVAEANHQGIPVTVCGEVASDPRFTSLLLGLGVRELSMASRYIPQIKEVVRRTSIVESSRLVEEVLKKSTAIEIQEFLEKNYEQA